MRVDLKDQNFKKIKTGDMVVGNAFKRIIVKDMTIQETKYYAVDVDTMSVKGVFSSLEDVCSRYLHNSDCTIVPSEELCLTNKL